MKAQQDFLQVLFRRISKKLAKPYQQLQQYQLALRKNWFDTPQALKCASKSDLDKMNIPLRLVTAIREELAQAEGQNSPSKVGLVQIDKAITAIKQNLKEGSPAKTQLNEMTIAVMVKNMQQGMMEKYPWVGPQLLAVFETVQKIISNIVRDPYQLKFRQLRKNNAKIRQVVVENPPVLTLLKQIGFQDEAQTICLDKFQVHELYFVQDCLNAVVANHREQNKLQQKAQFANFQPKNQQNLCLPQNIKLPSLNSQPQKGSSLNQVFSKQKLSEANYAQMLDQLVLLRSQMMATPPKNRNIKIYHKRHQVRQTNFQEVDFESQLSGADNVTAQYWKGIIAMNKQNSNFQSRRKMQFQHLLKQKVYNQTVIKIRLPNQYVLQALFGPLQTLQEVLNLAIQIVVGDIYLYQAPPVKRLDKQLYQTLQNLDSVPTGTFFLGINSEWYIKNQYLGMIKK